MSNATDPGQQSGNKDSGDEYGTDPDTGQCGTIPDNWWQSDGEATWTDNHGNEHTFEVNDSNW